MVRRCCHHDKWSQVDKSSRFTEMLVEDEKVAQSEQTGYIDDSSGTLKINNILYVHLKKFVRKIYWKTGVVVFGGVINSNCARNRINI